MRGPTTVKDGVGARACKLLIQDVNATKVPKSTPTPSCNIGPNNVDADSGDEEPIADAIVRKRQRGSALKASLPAVAHNIDCDIGNGSKSTIVNEIYVAVLKFLHARAKSMFT